MYRASNGKSCWFSWYDFVLAENQTKKQFAICDLKIKTITSVRDGFVPMLDRLIWFGQISSDTWTHTHTHRKTKMGKWTRERKRNHQPFYREQIICENGQGESVGGVKAIWYTVKWCAISLIRRPLRARQSGVVSESQLMSRPSKQCHRFDELQLHSQICVRACLLLFFFLVVDGFFVCSIFILFNNKLIP